MIPKSDRDMAIYLNELLRANKPEQQNDASSFLKPESPGKTEDHTPILTLNPKEMHELKGKTN